MNKSTGEVKSGTIVLNGDTANMSKKISSHVYSKFGKTSNGTKAPSFNAQAILAKLDKNEQAAFKLFFGDKFAVAGGK